MSDTPERILQAVDDARDDLVDFASALVRIPTVNPPGENYRECAELIGDRLKRFGFDVGFYVAEDHADHSPDCPRVNVVGRREGASKRPLLHLNGHTDVVPPGTGWSVELFSGAVRDGRLFGRGVSDMKAVDVRREIHDTLQRLEDECADRSYRLDELMMVEPVETPGDSALLDTLKTAVERVLGRPPELVASPGTYDHKHVARIAGIEHCVAYGPGRLELAHRVDEYCEVEELVNATKVLALAVHELVGH